MPTDRDDRDRDMSIGALEAFAEGAGRRLEKMDEKLDRILERGGETSSAVKVLTDRVDRIEPIVDDLNSTDRKGTLTLSLAGGTGAFGFLEGARLALHKLGLF